MFFLANVTNRRLIYAPIGITCRGLAVVIMVMVKVIDDLHL